MGCLGFKMDNQLGLRNEWEDWSTLCRDRVGQHWGECEGELPRLVRLVGGSLLRRQLIRVRFLGSSDLSCKTEISCELPNPGVDSIYTFDWTRGRD